MAKKDTHKAAKNIFDIQHLRNIYYCYSSTQFAHGELLITVLMDWYFQPSQPKPSDPLRSISVFRLGGMGGVVEYNPSD